MKGLSAVVYIPHIAESLFIFQEKPKEEVFDLFVYLP